MFDNLRLKTLAVGFALLAGSMPAAMAAPATDAGQTAQVWFLRPTSATEDTFGAQPMIYANGVPVGAIPANTAFHRDFAPGTYNFTVDPYGNPTGQVDTLQLAPGSQSYVEIVRQPDWQLGVAGGAGRSHENSFAFWNLSPYLAQMWLPSLSLLGRG
jgi:hypothetical protein